MESTPLKKPVGIACMLLLATACNQSRTPGARDPLCSVDSECKVGYVCDATSQRCAGAFFPLKGSVDGLEASRALQLQQGDEVITLSANGPFAFAKRVQQDAIFSVRVVMQPRGLTCAVNPAAGTMNGDATSIQVKCTRIVGPCVSDSGCDIDAYCDLATHACRPSNFTVAGEVVGLGSKQTIELRNRNDGLTVQGSRKFTFAIRLRDQDSYNVSIAVAPAFHQCKVTGGAGAATADIASVRVECTCTAETFPDRLQCLPFPWDAISPSSAVLYLTQPLDHENPELGSFSQRAALALRSGEAPKDRPLAIGTGGYELQTPFHSDPGAAFDGYDIRFEHRFFDGSWPRDSNGTLVPLDFKYLNVKQTADDAHAWIQAVKPYFTGKRIMTGVSKGGVHSLVFAYYYPDDVDATVAYVAPNIHGLRDPVFAEWINNNIGGSDYAHCRRALVDFVVETLRERSTIASLIAPDSDIVLQYPKDSLDALVQKVAYEMRWNFWQRYGPSYNGLSCDNIPNPRVGDFPTTAHWFLERIALIESRGEPSPVEWTWAAFQFQGNTEMGTVDYGYFPERIANEIDFKLLEDGPQEVFPAFMPQRMQAVETYIEQRARRVIIIYGALDPWSASQYQVNRALDSYVFVAPGLNHSASIYNLAPTDYDLVLGRLEEWLSQTRSPNYRRVVLP